MNGRRWLVVTSASAVLLITALVWTLAVRDDEHATPINTVTAVSAADAMRKVESLTAIVHDVDRIEAKLVTEGEVTAAGSPDVQFAGAQPARPIWAVAVSGDLQTEFGRGQPVTWSVFLVDATTGGIGSQMADNGPRWPPFFDALSGEAVVGR